MKIITGLSLVLFSFQIWAADFAAFSSMTNFKVINDKGVEVFKEDISNIKNVDLREDKAAITTVFNNLTVVDQAGKKIIDNVFAQSYGMTSKNIATLGGNLLKVFSSEGELRFSANWVSAVGISDTMVAYRDLRAGKYLVVKDLEGNEIFSQFDNASAKISNNFVFALDNIGNLTLIDKNGNTLFYSRFISEFHVSDNFAVIKDNTGFTKIFNKNGDIVNSGFKLEIKALLNEAIAYEQTGSFHVVDKDANQIFWSSPGSKFSLLDSMLAIRDHANMVRFVNATGDIVRTERNAQNFTISKSLISVQNSPNHVLVMEADGGRVFEEQSANLMGFSQSNHLFALRGTTGNTLRIFNHSTKILDAMRVQDVWLTTTNPFLNFKAF